MICAECVFAIMTFAAWKMNKVIGVGLLILMFGYTAIQGYLLYELIVAIFINTGTNVLTVTNHSGYVVTMWREYTGLAVVEFIVLALMAISAFRSYALWKTSLLWHVVHRDCILFYAYLLCTLFFCFVSYPPFPVSRPCRSYDCKYCHPTFFPYQHSDLVVFPADDVFSAHDTSHSQHSRCKYSPRDTRRVAYH